MGFQFFRKKEFLWLIGIAVVFVALHLPGLDRPYHQDEYKWPIIVNPALTEPGGIPHPPVGEFIYRQAGFLIGYDNFRVVPFVFGFINLFLLFYLARMIFGPKGALWSAGLYAISFYSLLASAMVDTDGAVMPLFFLIMSIGYFKLRKINFQFSIFNFQNSKWVIVLLISAALGFLTKASFVIAIAAIVLDFAIEKGAFKNRKRLLKYSAFGLGGVLGLGLLLYLSQFVFSGFRLDWTLNYWKGFIKFDDRGWLQTFIQFAKSIFYLSPLLVLPAVFSGREIFKRARPFFLFIFIGLFFYLILFDFSGGALDRYFQFLIIPLCIISGAVFAGNSFPSLSADNFLLKISSARAVALRKARSGNNFLLPIIIALLIFLTQFFNHFAPPLYPKTEFINGFASGEWNFLFPFMGGSGPLPFYISFLFMALIWAVGIIFAVSALIKKDLKQKALMGILILGIVYNGVFVEEYLFGKLNGSAKSLVQDAAAFIEVAPDIKKVVVYNDNGGYEIQKSGKYERRLYATPQFEETYKEFFKNFSGHILYIDIPKMGGSGFYSNYINSCRNIYNKKDRYITAQILECK